jgi:hypothetical protein
MLRTHEHELALGELGVFAGALDLRPPQPIDFGFTPAELVEDLERHLKRRGRHGLEHDPTHRLVETRAGNDLTGRLGGLDPSPLAEVVLGGMAAADGIAHGHPEPTAPADHHALQERDPFARRTAASIGAVAGSIGEDCRLIRLVLVPREVARVRIGQKDLPLRARQASIASGL